MNTENVIKSKRELSNQGIEELNGLFQYLGLELNSFEISKVQEHLINLVEKVKWGSRKNGYL